MLFDIVPKVCQSLVPACNKHFGYALEGITHGPEKFMLHTHAAAVLAGVVLVRVDFSLRSMFGAELKDLGGLVVDEGDGMEESHALQAKDGLDDCLCVSPHRLRMQASTGQSPAAYRP